jgi:predicted nuclease of predicted toxin-antitoxin system
VKILIDAQLPPGLKLMLAEAGHKAHHVVDVDGATRMMLRCGDTLSGKEPSS